VSSPREYDRAEGRGTAPSYSACQTLQPSIVRYDDLHHSGQCNVDICIAFVVLVPQNSLRGHALGDSWNFVGSEPSAARYAGNPGSSVSSAII